MLENMRKDGEIMEKDRGGRVIAIVALMIGVVGLTIGFAAFTNTLTIKSDATVTPDSSLLNVAFSNENAANTTAVTTPDISATLNPSNVTDFTAEHATINNAATGGPIIENLSVSFTAPGQTATYEFYTKNIGTLNAYLSNVVFNNVTGGSSSKVCTKVTENKTTDQQATDALVAAACNDISLTLTLGSENFTTSTARAGFNTATTHDLVSTASEKVTVTITYAANGAQADGDFTVDFGDIQLVYKSVA